MDALRAFFGKMKEDASFQEGFRRHMGQAMRGMDGDIMAMRKRMNDKIARGFSDYARENGFPVEDGAMDAVLREVNEGLHQKMDAIFRQEFAEAIGRIMQ